MCGIVGWAFDPNLAEDQGLIEAASNQLKSRGPDASGSWTARDGVVTFGHRRLSVLDVSPTGAQPMRSSDGRFVITFNGEIYNHLELRERLEREGGVPQGGWRGTSDTETLIASVAAWGVDDTLKAASGMLAFGLWDARNRSLTLARDRFGEKPLYVARTHRGIAFASELKALEGLPGFDTTIDSSALAFFLGHGYVQAPATIYRATSKLVPGSYVTLTEANMAALPSSGDFLASLRCYYWRLIDVAQSGLSAPFLGTESEAVDELEKRLMAAVRRQQISDVPLGAFLSGGIDSSAVVALMQASGETRVKTFTIGFEDGDYDESVFAEKVAAHLRTDHTTVMMSPNEALERIDRLPAIWDEPFADVAQLPALLLSEVTRRSVTVALSGDGGDELFGGYDRYSWTESAWTKLKGIPLPARRALANAVRLIPPSQWDRVARLLPGGVRSRLSGDRIHKIAALIPAANVSELYETLLSSWKSRDPLLLGEQPRLVPHWSGYPTLPTIAETFMLRDAVDYMTDDVLVKVDRAAMSVSLETRAPILDPQVAAFAWQLPLAMKRSGGTNKLVLRKLVHRYVPAELVERPKAGFAVPLDDWLRGPMRAWAETHLSAEALTRGGLNADPIRRAWQAHLIGTENHRYFLWNVLTYQAWMAHRLH